LEHPGGVVQVGHGGDGFAFDNETPRHDVLLRPFRIASRPVSNGEYSAFIADGGYRRPEFWLSDGWAMVRQENWQAPLYWLKDDDGTESVFTLSGVQALDPHAPLEHVSFFEAAAYAAWAGKRLPTEFEWEAMSSRFSHGQVWEWTRSSYDPYPGFRPFEGIAAEYNGKFMVGQLVLRGGSVATPPGHMRPTYRNFFPASARWQFSGIRLAEDI
jgi:formylglycine-generating enzyme required for sulfatase activity